MTEIHNQSVLKKSFLLFAFCLLAACSTFKQNTTSVEKNVQTNQAQDKALYQQAQLKLKQGDFSAAIKGFESLVAQYPASPLAKGAQLEMAYAYYRYGEDDTAEETVSRFLRLNPGHGRTDYAYYLRGLINFNRDSNLFNKIFPRKISDLDSVVKKRSYQDFSRVVARYPNSQYAEDAKHRLQHLSNTLAETEVNIAKYYLGRYAWLAAFNRAEYTIKHYQGTPSIIPALKIKIQAAKALGKDDIAEKSLRVLKKNFPQAHCKGC